jgi:hypothetical protein
MQASGGQLSPDYLQVSYVQAREGNFLLALYRSATCKPEEGNILMATYRSATCRLEEANFLLATYRSTTCKPEEDIPPGYRQVSYMQARGRKLTFGYIEVSYI